MVIITAATVVLVLISSLYALQVLTRQKAVGEFEATQNSMLAFDDALRDIAWDPEGSRSVLFTTQYGSMRLIDGYKNYTISTTGLNDTFTYSFTTAAVKYQMPYGYSVSGSGSSYILGDARTIFYRLNDSPGQILLEHGSESASFALNYRVRISEQGQMLVGSTTYNYIDIFVIRLKCQSVAIDASDFSLVCKNIGMKTESVATYSEYSSVVYTITNDSFARILVSDNASPASESNYVDLVQDLNLTEGAKVIFNLIVAEVRVST